MRKLLDLSKYFQFSWKAKSSKRQVLTIESLKGSGFQNQTKKTPYVFQGKKKKRYEDMKYISQLLLSISFSFVLVLIVLYSVV